MIASENTETLIKAIEEKLAEVKKDRVPFPTFLEEKMDAFDYSNTALAKKVWHRMEKKNSGEVSYVPVTRQAIGAWLKGSLPSSREIYISLGLAFHMKLEEINYLLLETYMGYGLYCKNIEDALWIAVINGLFEISDFEKVRCEIEMILSQNESETDSRSLATTDLWVMLSEVKSLEQFYQLISSYKEEFRDGTKRFGQCLDEVIEEEYGYYEKAAWFLRDIGCLHCEAQFSKIRAGKAVVTREWLLRFCIALLPTCESIEKLLAKAQMQPLGVTPAEVILKMISKYKADSLANSQEIWMLMESVTDELCQKGYEIEEDLCRKYNSVYELPTEQKWWLSYCIGKQLLENEKKREFGYEKAGYCRYAMVDKVLFDDVNRNKKSSLFKKNAAQYIEKKESDFRELDFQEISALHIEKGFQADVLDLEKFADYCYVRRPSRLSKDFLMNDIYFYCALLYSIWTGRCFQKNFEEREMETLRLELEKQNLMAEEFFSLTAHNLSEDAVYDSHRTIESILEALCKIQQKSRNI